MKEGQILDGPFEGSEPGPSSWFQFTSSGQWLKGQEPRQPSRSGRGQLEHA
jgi:hypothetical protein